MLEARGLPASAARPENMDSYLGTSYGTTIPCENGFVVAVYGGAVTAYDRSGNVIRTFYENLRNHRENWVKAIRSRKTNDLHADIAGDQYRQRPRHVGNVSYRELWRPWPRTATARVAA